MTPTEKALIAEYETILEREGLGVLDSRRTHASLAHPQGRSRSDSYGHRSKDTPEARAAFWSAVSSGVAELPRNYPLRAFLATLAQTANVLGSCRTHGISHDTGRWAFRKFLHGVGLGRARAARYS